MDLVNKLQSAFEANPSMDYKITYRKNGDQSLTVWLNTFGYTNLMFRFSEAGVLMQAFESEQQAEMRLVKFF